MKIKSAGSAIYGLRAAIAACGDPGSVTAATDHGHDIHRHVIDGRCDADIVIIPAEMLEDLDQLSLLSGARRRIGFTGVGYCVRRGDAVPKIDDQAALLAAVQAARVLFLTTAPTGLHMQACLEDMGLGAVLATRLRLFDRATEMLAALAKEESGALAFGPTTELMAWRDRGIDYGGSVPFEFDVPLAYDAAVLASSSQKADAADLLDYLAGPEGLRHFRASGVS